MTYIGLLLCIVLIIFIFQLNFTHFSPLATHIMSPLTSCIFTAIHWLAAVVSWLPNGRDPDTGEVVTLYSISCQFVWSSYLIWRVEKRYGEFLQLYDTLKRLVPAPALRGMNNKFPDDRLFKFVTWVDDAKRQARMEKMNLWLDEICRTPQVGRLLFVLVDVLCVLICVSIIKRLHVMEMIVIADYIMHYACPSCVHG